MSLGGFWNEKSSDIYSTNMYASISVVQSLCFNDRVRIYRVHFLVAKYILWTGQFFFENGTGGFYPDGSIDERYTSIDIELINYVGEDILSAWESSGAEFNVHSFIEFTQIPQSTFTSIMRPEYPEETLTNFRKIFGEELTLSELQDMLGFSLEEIDALYSGDQAEINRAFCGPYGVFNETDGQIYGLKWLASHSAEDYVKAGLPLEQVNEVLMRVTEEYSQGSGFFELAQKTEETLTSAIALEAELAADADTEKPNSEQEDVSADDENVAE